MDASTIRPIRFILVLHFLRMDLHILFAQFRPGMKIPSYRVHFVLFTIENIKMMKFWYFQPKSGFSQDRRHTDRYKEQKLDKNIRIGK